MDAVIDRYQTGSVLRHDVKLLDHLYRRTYHGRQSLYNIDRGPVVQSIVSLTSLLRD